MHDLYQTVTDRIIEALDRCTPPWARPWSTVTDAIPVNAQTRRPYRGINFTLLSLQASCLGYDVNRWLTYRQALELGGQVRKGEQGTPIVFWQLRKVAAVAETFPDTNPVAAKQGLSAAAGVHGVQRGPGGRPRTSVPRAS